MVFVGYANNGYRLWNSQTKSVEIARNVTFDETQPSNNDSSYDPNDNEQLYPSIQVRKNYEEIRMEKRDQDQQEEVETPETGESPTIEPVEETTNDAAESDNDANEDDESTEQQAALRRGTRNRKQPTLFLYSANMQQVIDECVPQSISELKKLEDWQHWQDAINDELKSLDQNKTWEVVNCPSNVKPIQSKWVFAKKDDGRYKARLVAKGCSQRPGFDYNETFAPVAKMESVRLLLILANEYKLLVHQMDVKTAFLYGDLDEDIFMKLPTDEKGVSQTVRLKKSLYGLKQASRNWNKKFDDAVRELDFCPLKSDCCIYKSKSRGIILLLYVDDILILAKNPQDLAWIKSELGRLFQMKDMNVVKHFLGMEIQRDFENQKLEISQSRYVEKILRRFGMYDCKPVGTPLDPNVKWSKINQGETDHPYKELLGCLQYLTLTSRPDISTAVSTLSKYQSNATDVHWVGLKRILRYLRGTVDTKLIYEKRPYTHTVKGYADADFANDPDDRRSVSGYAFEIFGSLVSWSTKRQQTVSLSTSEAELIALCTAVAEGLWLVKCLQELDVVSIPFVIMEDNIPCISIAEEPRSHQRMKHLDIKYMFIRDHIKEGKLKLQFIRSEDQPADAFTKGLPKETHRRLLGRLNIRIAGKC